MKDVSGVEEKEYLFTKMWNFRGKFRATAKSLVQPNSATTHSLKAETFPTLSFWAAAACKNRLEETNIKAIHLITVSCEIISLFSPFGNFNYRLNFRQFSKKNWHEINFQKRISMKSILKIKNESNWRLWGGIRATLNIAKLPRHQNIKFYFCSLLFSFLC